MKIVRMAAAVCCFLLPAVAGANEFQPLGALGIGGAGVARTTDAYATYWNPAGLAFYEKPFSAKLNAGVGINITSSLAENADKLGRMDINALQDLAFATGTGTTADNLRVSAQAVEFVGVVNDLDRNKGTLTATPGGMLAFQYRNFGVGAFVTSELGSFPVSDTVNVRLGDQTGTTTLSNFATGIGATVGTPAGTLFNATQRAQMEAAFFNGGANGVTAAQATAIVNTLEGQLQSSTGNKSGQNSQQLADAMIRVANSFSNNLGSIADNTSTIELRSIVMADFPIAYGHRFDLGSFGKIGLGAAFKVIRGTVFSSSEQVVNIKDSGDIIKRATDNKEDSINFGVDLGALWRYADMLNVGIVAKNLNSPEFDSPTLPGAQAGRKFRVDPQLRMGVAVEPLSWLTVAADCDLSKNSTMLPSRKSQNIGGGFDLHPLNWFALRLGMYANLADSSTGPVGTVGFSLGPQWMRLDIDGAASFETGRYKDSTYPREARVEFAMSTMF